MNKPKPTIEKIYLTLSIIFLSILLPTGIYFVYSNWINARNGAYLSCLASIANEIDKNKSTLSIDANNKWNILSAKETDEIFSKIQPYDCSNPANPSNDLWNNKIQVAARKSDDGTKIIVWSKGSDKISQTEDDLVVPYGEIPPK